MTIFKKTLAQGNFILSNGQQCLFDAEGYFETESENVIEQLTGTYEIVDSREVAAEQGAAEEKQATSTVGAKSSASLVKLTKSN